MNTTPDHTPHSETNPSGAPDEQVIHYPTGGPGAAFVSHMSLRLMAFLWLVGLVPGGILANTVGGDPGELAPGELPVGGFVVVGWGLVWTVFWIYFIVSRSRRGTNEIQIGVSAEGVSAADHFGTVMVMSWEDVASIGWVRMPSAGAGLAKVVTQRDASAPGSGKVNSADGLIGWANVAASPALPRRARRILADHPANEAGLHRVGIAFITAGRVDTANLLVAAARKARPELFENRSVREAR